MTSLLAWARIALVSLLALAATGATAVAFDESSRFADGWSGGTDGQFVVWIPNDSGSIQAARIDGGDARIVYAPEIGGAYGPFVDQGVVLWTLDGPAPQRGNVYAKDLNSGQMFSVAETTDEEVAVALSGRWAVWIAQDLLTDRPLVQLWTRDFRAGTPPILVASVEDTPGVSIESLLGVAIDGDRIIWNEASPTMPNTWRVKSRLLPDGHPTTIPQLAGQMCRALALHGALLVCATNEAVLAHSLDTGDMRTIGAGDGFPNWLTTDGRYILWSSYTDTIEPRPLQGYDLATESQFHASSDITDFRPELAEGIVTWSRVAERTHVSIRGDVHVARLRDLLPSASRPNPGTTDPNWTYFQETGHYLAFGFRDFWRQSGGLPVFGFSLTEEFAEHGLTVQYVERQRFEYHPEHAGTPYEVELGRLGYEDAEQHGLLAEPAFVRGPTPSLSPDSVGRCRFFNETGFLVCDDFYRYWQTHGLEFGDPDISFRESLALFGYPISNPHVDPTSGLTVQYFERARFEYHPNNPEPYRVLLGRLGADLLAERGW